MMACSITTLVLIIFTFGVVFALAAPTIESNLVERGPSINGVAQIISNATLVLVPYTQRLRTRSG